MFVIVLCAGVVPIVHDSGGPQADIVRPELTAVGPQITGYRCTTVEEYAEAITTVLCMDQQKRLTIAAAARRYAMPAMHCLSQLCSALTWQQQICQQRCIVHW